MCLQGGNEIEVEPFQDSGVVLCRFFREGEMKLRIDECGGGCREEFLDVVHLVALRFPEALVCVGWMFTVLRVD